MSTLNIGSALVYAQQQMAECALMDNALLAHARADRVLEMLVLELAILTNDTAMQNMICVVLQSYRKATSEADLDMLVKLMREGTKQKEAKQLYFFATIEKGNTCWLARILEPGKEPQWYQHGGNYYSSNPVGYSLLAKDIASVYPGIQFVDAYRFNREAGTDTDEAEDERDV